MSRRLRRRGIDGRDEPPPPPLRHGEKPRTQTTASLIAQAAAVPVSQAYLRFFEQWTDQLHSLRAMLRYGVVNGRLLIGLGAESVIETNITLHHTFGVPMIPGSAIKGLLAAYVRQRLDPAVWGPGTDAWRVLFGEGGDQGSAGSITYFDALPDYSGHNAVSIQPDVLAVHHPEYYNQADPQAPADWDSPIPVALASVTGQFLFALSGPESWLPTVYKLLEEALEQMGIGAKTSSGYGRLELRNYALQAGKRVQVRRETWDEVRRVATFSAKDQAQAEVIAIQRIAERQAIPPQNTDLRYIIESRPRLASGIILLTVVPA